jgi:hypothetical protein
MLAGLYPAVLEQYRERLSLTKNDYIALGKNVNKVTIVLGDDRIKIGNLYGSGVNEIT